MHSRRVVLGAALVAVVSGAGCCLSPTAPVRDGGPHLDAGRDAGVDAGPPLGCQPPSTFTAPEPISIKGAVWDFAALDYGNGDPQNFAVATSTAVQLYEVTHGGGFSLGPSINGGETRLIAADVLGDGSLMLVGANSLGSI